MSKPVKADSFNLPLKSEIDKTLILGNLLFGVGWGLIGLCPGPVIASLSAPSGELIYFLIAMLVGMILTRKTIN